MKSETVKKYFGIGISLGMVVIGGGLTASGNILGPGIGLLGSLLLANYAHYDDPRFGKTYSERSKTLEEEYSNY
jgi:hypothetical protein